VDIGILKLGWRDLVDIALVAALFYWIILFVRDTRAVTAIYGLLSLAIIYVVAAVVGLHTLEWLLEHLFGALFLVIVILFHQDIRRALAEMDARRLFRKKHAPDAKVLDLVITAAESMSASRTGAIIVFERNVPLGDMMQQGVSLEAEVSVELLLTIFKLKTPLHDGAVIIRRNKIAAAACILPLGVTAEYDFGTRHRAGLGITQESDAVALIVSEERGYVTIAVSGKLSKPLSGRRLSRVLHNILEK
jgi:uncharacterized protein (TIGR00159 family)